jgi:drug/metabolite transporter (DMT)-like permease
MPRSPTSADWLSLVALAVMWGSAFMLNELALASLTPSVIVAARVAFAALLVFAYLRATGDALPAPGKAWLPMVVLAVFGNVLPFHLIAWAQQHLDSSTVGVLMAVMPLFVLTLAHFFIPGARLTPFRLSGFVVGFAGVCAIIGPDFAGESSSNLALWGTVATLGAVLSYSVSTIYARRLGAGDPVRRAAALLIVASALSLPAAIVDVPAIAAPDTAAVVAVLLLGLFATGAATLLYFRVVQGPGPTFLSLVNYLMPAWAVLAGAFLLGESISPAIVTGLALILTGVALSEFGPRLLTALQSARQRIEPASITAIAGEDA